jgi:hypothetical protein
MAALALWLAGCKPLPQPDQVKKVEECVDLFKKGVDPVSAKVVARSLLEEKALVEEAVESIHQCWEQVSPDTPNRDVLVSEILEWIKEWDNLGRPKYLAQFYGYFLHEPAAREARQMSAAAYSERLDTVDKDENAGLRAILLLLTKALGDNQPCTLMQGTEVDGKAMDKGHLMGLFASPDDVNAWSASGLELTFEPKPNCPGAVKVELFPAPTPEPGKPKLRARVTITRDDVMLFDKEYAVEPQGRVLFSDFLIP